MPTKLETLRRQLAFYTHLKAMGNHARTSYGSREEIAARLSRLPVNPIETPKFFEDPETDTQGYLAFYSDHVVVAFRGTQEPADWQTGFDLTQVHFSSDHPVFVHRGFVKAMRSVFVAQMLPHLVSHVEDRTLPIHFAGHSLGGAVATLAMYHYMSEVRPHMHGLANTSCHLYTFASPRCGTSAFAQDFRRHMSASDTADRMTHHHDHVPHLPPDPLEASSLIDWEHVGREIELPGKTATDWGPWLWSWVPIHLTHDHGIADHIESLERERREIQTSLDQLTAADPARTLTA